MVLPFKCKNPPESFPYATAGLIALNVFIFSLTADILPSVVDRFAESPAHFTPLRILASMFLHANLFHLASNMWFLYLFGTAVEGRLRWAKFLWVYFAAGFLGSAFQLGVTALADRNVPGIGASGAVMGVMGAALYLFPFSQVRVGYFFGFSLAIGKLIWGIRDVAMYWIAIAYVGIDLISGLYGNQDGVAHMAHVGGVLGGIIACAWTFPLRDSKEASDTKSDIADYCDLGMISKQELLDITRGVSKPSTLILRWTAKCVGQGRFWDECRRRFVKYAPEILSQEPPAEVAKVLLGMDFTGEKPRPDWLLENATRLDNDGEYALAVDVYDALIFDQWLQLKYRELPLFRSAEICYLHRSLPEEARLRYKLLLKEFPMCRYADQARERLAQMAAPAAEGQA